MLPLRSIRSLPWPGAPAGLKAFISACLLAALFGIASHLHAASGDLDPSFAGTGMIRVGFGFGEDYGDAVAVQPDGKLVVAGASGPFGYEDGGFVGGHFSLVRLDTNNTPDAAFGFGGKVITPVSAAGLDWATANATTVKVQADGKIVAAGYAYTRSNHLDFTLVRYNPDGSPDTTFGESGTGIVYTDFGDGSMVRDMVILADGRIIAVGHTTYQANAGEGAVALARYLTNGVLDASFGNGGKQITTGITGYTGAHAVTIQPDGKILAVGIGIGAGHIGGIDFALYRYTTNGFLDPQFGAGTGKVFTQISANTTPGFHYFDSANAVVIQPGNFTVQSPDKILVAGTYRNMDPGGSTVVALARYGLDGFLDSTFGNGGIVTNAVGPGGSTANAIAIQGIALRKILVAGTSTSGGKSRFMLARYTLAGAFDGTFAGGGQVITPIGPTEDEASAMIFQGGRIVLAGYSRVNEHDSDFALARYNSDGSPDNSFDRDGILTVGVVDRPSPAKGVAIQSDGKIVVAGYADNGVKEVATLTRFNPNGSLDISFGANGKVVAPMGAGDARMNAVAIQPDGKILTAGTADARFAVARYNTNGSLDDSFGMNGVATTSIGVSTAEATAITLQPDGKIVAAGTARNSANGDFAVVRYTTNGIPDSSFNGNGKVLTPIGSQEDLASAVKIQADGKIVVAGSSVVGTSVDIAAARYHTNGLLDNSFGTLGKTVTDISFGSYDLGESLAIQPNGRIIVGGISFQGPISFAAVRYLTNGVLDNSFDGDGKVTTSIGLGLDDQGFALALQNDGKIIMAGSSTAGGRQFSAVRYNVDGSPDDSYGTGGKVIADFGNGGENIGYAVALDSLGRAVIAGDATGLFGVVRLQADPMLKIRSVVRRADGQVLLEGLGIPGITHSIQAGSNPGSFAPLGTVTPNEQGTWQYQDASAAGLPMRLYRLLKP